MRGRRPALLSTTTTTMPKGPMSNPRPQLIFLSPHNPNDVGTWSGTAYSVYHGLLDAGAHVEIVRSNWTEGIARMAARVLRAIGIGIDLRRSVMYAYLASKEASLRLAFTRGDVIVAVAAAPYVFSLSTSRPLVFVSDATFACIKSIYSVFAGMPQWLSDDADKVERDSLHKSSHVLFSSEWAKSSAIVDYGVEPDAISVQPMGPNIRREVIERFQPTKSADFRRGVRLLFIGADWDRKGGPAVLEIKRELESRGMPCELYLVGNCPKDLPKQHDIHVLGRLDKCKEEQLLELCRLYESAHFFILPTSAEAYGIVFSEAQAFGCPSLTYAVGGTPTAVLDGVTGFTLPLGATAKDFAESICSLVLEPRQYEQMSANCRRRYETEANWDIWAKAIINIADRLREKVRDSSVSQNG